MTSPLIALAGSPNAGKTALFNSLTGSRQKVANYAGVTVERKEGLIKLENDREIRLLDLPGAYSLRARSPDEAITRDVLNGKIGQQPDLVLCTVDMTNLRLHLRLVLEIKQLGLPVWVLLNMKDLAERRGIKIDADKLSAELGLPVIQTVAVRNSGLKDLREALSKTEITSGKITECDQLEPIPSRQLSIEVERILAACGFMAGKPPEGTHAIDRILLNPFIGSIILFTLLFLMFQAVFSWATPAMDLIDETAVTLGNYLSAMVPDGLWRSFIQDGLVAGIGSVIIFLPQILILYAFILLLEDSGYMARAAFMLDRLMGGVGLHGRAFIPLLSSFSCAIPGVMATRTIGSRSDRITTIMMAPMMTCSARIPVYTLMISAFIPRETIGWFNLQGLVMFGLYAAGLIGGLLIAVIMKFFVFRHAAESFIMELPTYKIPSLKNFALGLWERSKIFLRRAGTVIFWLMLVIWLASTFPQPPKGATEPAINYSVAGTIGRAFAPIFAPIGFSWEAVVALIPGMAAREVAVAALGTVYAVGDMGEDTTSLAATLAAHWSLPSALAFLVWYIFAPQCLSTIAVVKRETNSRLWPTVMLIGYFAIAYLAAWATYSFTKNIW